MVIFAKPFRCVLPFCGVFMCRNEAGNKLLRDMEPPRHDVWDPNHPEKGDNKKIEAEYVHFIRECIKDLVPVDESKVISVPGLSRFLPDDDESPEDAFEGGEQQKSESPDRSPLPEKIEGKRIDPRRATLQPDHADAGKGDEDTDGPGGDLGGGGGGDGGDDGGDGGSGDKGGAQGEQSKPTIPIRYRTFSTNIGAGVYAVTVTSEQSASKNATISVWAVGDDRKAPAEIRSARLSDGKEVQVKANGVLGPLVLPSKKASLHLEVRLREPLRLAMEVSAREAE